MLCPRVVPPKGSSRLTTGDANDRAGKLSRECRGGFTITVWQFEPARELLQLGSVDFHHIGSLQRAANHFTILEWRPKIQIEYHQRLALPQSLDCSPGDRM